MDHYEELDLDGINTESLADRPSKVHVADFGVVCPPQVNVRSFIDSLPDILAGRDIKHIIEVIVTARQQGVPVIFCYGAHVVKVGLAPVLIELIKHGVLTSIATNGAGAIHDVEIALAGKTSEDVSACLALGRFGIAQETAELLNQAAQEAYREELGLGTATARRLANSDAPHVDMSILAAAYHQGIPATVHVALGTDINHMHPSADGAAIGDATLRDFRIFAHEATKLQNGGVIIVAGSAVVLPLIIEKALAVVQNLGYDVGPFTGINLDFVKHYRSTLNPVTRAQEFGGQGLTLIGHHEINIPLIAAAVLEDGIDMLFRVDFDPNALRQLQHPPRLVVGFLFPGVDHHPLQEPFGSRDHLDGVLVGGHCIIVLTSRHERRHGRNHHVPRVGLLRTPGHVRGILGHEPVDEIVRGVQVGTIVRVYVNRLDAPDGVDGSCHGQHLTRWNVLSLKSVANLPQPECRSRSRRASR